MADWYYAKAGKQFGPITSAELKRMAQAGELVPDDLVFQEGGTQWVPSSTVKGLFAGSSSTPGRVTTQPREAAADDRPAAGPAPREAARPPAEPSERMKYLIDVLMFRRLVAPLMIMILFWVSVAAVLIASLITIFTGLFALFNGAVGGGLGMMLAGVIQIPVGILIVRLYCEMLILFFRMNETLTDIKDTLQREQKKD